MLVELVAPCQAGAQCWNTYPPALQVPNRDGKGYSGSAARLVEFEMRVQKGITAVFRIGSPTMHRDLHGTRGSSMGFKPSAIRQALAWRFNVVWGECLVMILLDFLSLFMFLLGGEAKV